MADLPLRCSCGQIAGHLTDFTPSMGTHAMCHCSSCRAAELQCGAADPGLGGVNIFQTSPYRLKITQGSDKLAVFSFGEKNLLRWQAACCGMAMFNTPRNPRLSFLGIRTTMFEDATAIGPVQAHGFIPTESGKTKHTGLMPLIGSALRRIAVNRLSGRWKDTPFFDTKTGKTVVEVEVLPPSRRADLLGT